MGDNKETMDAMAVAEVGMKKENHEILFVPIKEEVRSDLAVAEVGKKKENHEILFVPIKEEVRSDLWEESVQREPVSTFTSMCKEEVKEEMIIEVHPSDSAFTVTPGINDPLYEDGKEYVQGQDGTSSNYVDHSSNFLQETSIVLGTEDINQDHVKISNNTSDTGGCRDTKAINAQDVFSCTKCPAKFISSFLLEQHTQSHTGFFCKVCCARFRYSSRLKQHYLKHTGEKPYPCTLCSAKFTQNSYLSQHMLTHAAEKPFQCTLCPARFNHSSTRTKHILAHTGEKQFSCSVCSAKFTSSFNLKRHASTHTNKPFSCSVCAASFRWKTNLKQHISTHKKPSLKSNT